MTDDIVKRLGEIRALDEVFHSYRHRSTIDQARDRIEQLEAATAQWLAKWERQECEFCGSRMGIDRSDVLDTPLEDRIEQLEAALRTVVREFERQQRISSGTLGTVMPEHWLAAFVRRALEES